MPTFSYDGGIKGELNSTNTPLAAGATWNGTAEQNAFADMFVIAETDKAGILSVEASNDGTNFFAFYSGIHDPTRSNPPHVFVKGPRWIRVSFQNTSSDTQTFLRVSTYYGSFNKLTSPINLALPPVYDALATRPTDYTTEVALGIRQKSSVWNKFGYNLDVDSGGEEIIASFGGTFNIMTTADTLDIASTSSQDAVGGTGASAIQITGIDANNNEQTEIVVLTGTTTVTTTTTWLGLNRVVVVASGSNNANVGTITLSDTAGTFGTQAQLPLNKSVTEQCIFHTPINYSFLTKWLFFNVNRLSGGGGSPRVTIKGYSYSRVTQTTYSIFEHTIDTNVENTVELKPSEPFFIGGREVIYFTATSNSNNTVVYLRFSGKLIENIN